MGKAKSTTTKIHIKTYSAKEVAALYGVSSKTLKKWLKPFEKEIGKRIGYFYNPKQVRVIFEKLGLPDVPVLTTKIYIKTYSVKEVAVLYGVSSKTLKKWLRPFEKEIGKRIGYFYNPKQVRVIFEKLSLPDLPVLHLNF